MHAAVKAKRKEKKTCHSNSSPCAACKLQRRKCTQDCLFAPYFPPDQPQKFTTVHNVFGASNVAKILNEIHPTQREDAVHSLVFEAEARLKDPVHGCVGWISILQHQLKQLQTDLHYAKQELAKCIGPSATSPILNPGFIQQIPNIPSTSNHVLPYYNNHMQQMLGFPGTLHGNIWDAQHQEQEQEMSANLVSFDVAAVTEQVMSPTLAMGGSYDNYMYQIQQQQPQTPPESR